MRRLFASRISFQYGKLSGNKAGKYWLDMPVSRSGQLWWDPKDPTQGNLWKSWIDLGEDFFNAITAAPVPMDTRALRVLAKFATCTRSLRVGDVQSVLGSRRKFNLSSSAISTSRPN